MLLAIFIAAEWLIFLELLGRVETRKASQSDIWTAL